MMLFTLLVTAFRSTETLKCFSCASSEYHVLLDRSSAFSSRTARTPHFDRLCDAEDSVKALAAVESCHSSCITIYEPQFFGGLQSVHRPYLFIRGCADRIFDQMADRPREIDFLHRAPICVSLALSQIYPQVKVNELVQVCSCTDDGCNFLTTVANPSSQYSMLTLIFILLWRLFVYY